MPDLKEVMPELMEYARNINDIYVAAGKLEWGVSSPPIDSVDYDGLIIGQPAFLSRVLRALDTLDPCLKYPSKQYRDSKVWHDFDIDPTPASVSWREPKRPLSHLRDAILSLHARTLSIAEEEELYSVIEELQQEIYSIGTFSRDKNSQRPCNLPERYKQ